MKKLPSHLPEASGDQSLPKVKTMGGFETESQGYAASLRQLADMWDQDHQDMDSDELRAAADFIERQRADIRAFIALREYDYELGKTVARLVDNRVGDTPQKSWDRLCRVERAKAIAAFIAKAAKE